MAWMGCKKDYVKFLAFTPQIRYMVDLIYAQYGNRCSNCNMDLLSIGYSGSHKDKL